MSFRAVRESEKRVIEQGGECGGKPGGRGRQPPGGGSGMKWSVNCSSDEGRW